MEFFLNMLIFMGTFLILAQSYNLVLGYTGLVHVGHIAFMAVGAYTSALLSLSGVPFFIAALAGLVLASVVGFVLAVPTVRVKDDYLVAVTLGLGEITRSVLLNWRSVTEGALGLPGIPHPQFFGLTVNTQFEYVVFIWIIVLLVQFFVYRLTHSPFGRVLETIREDEVAALSLGKNVWKYKIIILVTGALLAGLGGILNAHFVTYIDPFVFNLDRMVFILVIVMVGGMGNFWGVTFSTLMLYFFFEIMRFLPLPSSKLGALRWLLFAIMLVIIMIYKPKGLLGKRILKKKF